MEQLNAAIKTGPNRKIGFLSQANFESVRGFLDHGAQPILFDDTSALYAAVKQEEVIAGLTSGVVHKEEGPFNVFPSKVISPRAFQMKKGDDSWQLLQATDAAIVRTQLDGELKKAVDDNCPFKATYVQNCYTGDREKVPFPLEETATGLLKDVIEKRVIRILAHGTPENKPNWKEDGNYQVDPPTGFWPDYVQYFLGQIQKEYGDDISLERVWMKGEEGTRKVLSGDVHMTEPYFIYEGLSFDNVPRKWTFEFSSIVMGYQQQYLTKKHNDYQIDC